MVKAFKILFLSIQNVITFMVLMGIYMLFVLLNYQGGFEELVGLAVFQPILGSILSSLTIVTCLTLGLPIRLNKRLNIWWKAKPFIPIAGVITGFILLSLSTTASFRETVQIEDEIIRTKQIPDIGLTLTGWILTAFCLLHIFPNFRILRKS